MENVEKIVCSICGEELSENDVMYNNNGDAFCECCYNDEYGWCDYCESETRQDEFVRVVRGGHEEYWCEHCVDNNATYCDDCNTYTPNDCYYYVDSEDRCVCEECYEDHYATCEDCGTIYHTDNLHYVDYEGYYCDECRERHDSVRLYGYHDFSDWQLFKSDSEDVVPYYIGYELEVENPNSDTSNQDAAIETIYNNLNAVCMHDGSLNSSGIEIVSHPQSFKKIQELEDIYRNTFGKITELGYRSHDTQHCGLHFHVTRPENDDVIDRIWLIMETYKQELIKFSRRSGSEISRWTQFASDYTTTEDARELKALYYYKKKKDALRGCRYMALNNTNQKTIEFRLFKGTLNYETFMASVELVNNIMTLCGDLSIPVNEITWSRLTETTYAHAYCQSREIYTSVVPEDLSNELIAEYNASMVRKASIKKIIMKISRKAISDITLNKTNFKSVQDLKQRYDEFARKVGITRELLEELRRVEIMCDEERYTYRNVLEVITNITRYYTISDDIRELLKPYVNEYIGQ